MNTDLLIASNDQALQSELASRFYAAGIQVALAPTPLQMVWSLMSRPQEAPAMVLLDARPKGFGTEALAWLRQEASRTCLVVLLNDGDDNALTRAELAEAAAIIPAPARPGAILRTVRRVLRGDEPSHMLRWIPPRAPPRIQTASMASSL
jgi:DNA-binding NarL/FixJ family response regulator